MKKNKILFFLLSIMFVVNGLNANASNRVETGEVIESMKFYDAPVLHSEEINLYKYYSNDFEEKLATLFSDEEIPQELEVFAKSTLPNMYDGLIKDIEMILEDNYTDISAIEYKKIYTHITNYYFDVYNSFAPLYNKYLADIEDVHFADFTDMLFPYLGWIVYNNLGYKAASNLDDGNHDLNKVYDRIYGELIAENSNTEEVEKQTFELMKNEVIEWIREMDIDYINAYQKQVKQYLTLCKELGYEITEDEEIKITDDYDTSDLKLKDIVKVAPLNLGNDFFNQNINQTGADFLKPDEVYESYNFQEYVDRITYELKNNSDYDKDTVINVLNSTISAEYYALSMPGSSAQPIMDAFPSLLAEYSYYKMELSNNKKIPDKITSWIDTTSKEAPYDTYRSLNYLKAPKIDLKVNVSKEITRTIKYELSDGTKVTDSIVQTLKFVGTKNLITNKIIWDDETLVFESIENPVLNNLITTEKADRYEINHNSENIEQIVIYHEQTNTSVDKESDDSVNNDKPDHDNQPQKKPDKPNHDNQTKEVPDKQNNDISRAGIDNNVLLFVSLLLISLVGIKIKLSK